MNIFHKKNNKKRLPNLVPLINIVFLLLIFFMLSGTLTKKDFFEVSPPESNTGASAEAPELVILISKDNKIALDNKPIKVNELEAILSKELENRNIEEVLIKADGNAKSGILSQVIKHIRNAGIKRAAIVTQSKDKT
jgi:biopolymer transport protein ExbD